MDFHQIAIKEILTVSFTLFAVIDMVGNIPVLASLRMKMGGEIRSAQATLASGALMILFLFIGKQFWICWVWMYSLLLLPEVL